MDRKTRKVQYKIASFLKDLAAPGENLEKLLRRAVRRKRLAVERLHTAGDENSDQTFLNYSLTHKAPQGANLAMYCCELLYFEAGADQSSIKMNPTAEVVDLAAVGPAGKDEEFLAGSVYFGVFENHVVVMGSRSLQVKHLESYLNWLFQHAKVIPEGNLVELRDHIPDEVRQQVMQQGVTGINFKGQVDWKASAAASPVKPVTDQVRAVSIKTSGAMWGAVQSLFGNKIPSGFTSEDIQDTPDIEISLQLRWKGRHGKDDNSFLDGVASNLRHLDDEVDYEVMTKSGKITRDEVKIYQPVTTPWKDGRPDFDDLFPKLCNWLEHLLSSGRIEP